MRALEAGVERRRPPAAAWRHIARPLRHGNGLRACVPDWAIDWPADWPACARSSGIYIRPACEHAGGMAEWLKAHAWKACIRATVSWVRIPLPPPDPDRSASAHVDHRPQKSQTNAAFFLRLASVHVRRSRLAPIRRTWAETWVSADTSMARTLHRVVGGCGGCHQEPGYYADGGGLYLRVAPGGTRAWIFRFTMDGKTRDGGLGSYPTVSLAKARAEAERCRQLLAGGLDPIEARKKEREAAARGYSQGHDVPGLW